ncbi:MAG TPA: glycosyltransferase [Gemmatimonadaceae bacterium]|nr:glycosyltransferase [Gemmatimonadaceae bacterium]
MRIAVIVESFPELSETFILRQITGLLELGHDVAIFANRSPARGPVHAEVREYALGRRVRYVHPPNAAERSWRRDTLLALRVAMRRPRAMRLLRRAQSAEFGGFRSLLSRLPVLLPGGGYDVVHCHFGDVALAYRFAAAYWHIPFIASFHGFDYSRYPAMHGAGVYEPLFRTVDCVTVNGAYARARLEELGCPPPALRVLHYGVPLDDGAAALRRAEHSNGAVRLLTVARLVEKKGVEYAIRAVARVARTAPALRYDIIGEGPLRGELEALARALGVGDRVVFHGARAQDAVRAAMMEADIFVLPSVTATDGDQEGTPTVLIEASSYGLPVVSTHHSGIPEVVLDEASGFLVAERDVEALADRLECLVAHPERRVAMGRAGRCHIEREFDIQVLNRRLEALYREVIERGRERDGR